MVEVRKMKKILAVLAMIQMCAIYIFPVYAAENESIRPGIYSLNIEDEIWCDIDLANANKAKVTVSSEDGFGEFEGVATIEGNKVTIVNSEEGSNAQIIVTVKDDTAIIEANDQAEDYAGMNVFFSGTYKMAYYETRGALIVGNLVSNKQVPSYVRDKGTFDYNEDYNQVVITGDSVRLRSQPNADSRIIAAAHKNQTLSYRGEWTNPKGEKWILGGYNPEQFDVDELVWVNGQYAKPMTQEEYAALEQQISAGEAAVENQQSSTPTAQARVAEGPPSVTLVELLLNPENYAGKVVKIVGEFLIRDNSSQFFGITEGSNYIAIYYGELTQDEKRLILQEKHYSNTLFEVIGVVQKFSSSKEPSIIAKSVSKR